MRRLELVCFDCIQQAAINLPFRLQSESPNSKDQLMLVDLPLIRLRIRVLPSRSGRCCYIPIALYECLADRHGGPNSELLLVSRREDHGCRLRQCHAHSR